MQLLRCAGFLFFIVCLDGAEGINLLNLRANMDMPTQSRTYSNNAAKILNRQSMQTAWEKEGLHDEVGSPSQGSSFSVSLLSAA